jgi:hypothetical protein
MGAMTITLVTGIEGLTDCGAAAIAVTGIVVSTGAVAGFAGAAGIAAVGTETVSSGVVFGTCTVVVVPRTVASGSVVGATGVVGACTGAGGCGAGVAAGALTARGFDFFAGFVRAGFFCFGDAVSALHVGDMASVMESKVLKISAKRFMMVS